MRVIGWLSKIVLTTVLATGVSLFTTWFAVQLYVEKLLGQFQINVAGESPNFFNFVTYMSRQMNILNKDDNGHTTREESARPESSENRVDVQPPRKEDAVAAWSQVSTGQEQAAERQETDLVMSAEQFNQKKEMLSDEDKKKIFSILSANIPADEMQRLSQYAEDGISREELKQIQELVGKYLRQEEYSQLLSILNKYSP